MPYIAEYDNGIKCHYVYEIMRSRARVRVTIIIYLYIQVYYNYPQITTLFNVKLDSTEQLYPTI